MVPRNINPYCLTLGPSRKAIRTIKAARLAMSSCNGRMGSEHAPAASEISYCTNPLKHLMVMFEFSMAFAQRYSPGQAIQSCNVSCWGLLFCFMQRKDHASIKSRLASFTKHYALLITITLVMFPTLSACSPHVGDSLLCHPSAT